MKFSRHEKFACRVVAGPLPPPSQKKKTSLIRLILISDFNPEQWAKEKFTLGLDFPNVSLCADPESYYETRNTWVSFVTPLPLPNIPCQSV